MQVTMLLSSTLSLPTFQAKPTQLRIICPVWKWIPKKYLSSKGKMSKPGALGLMFNQQAFHKKENSFSLEMTTKRNLRFENDKTQNRNNTNEAILQIDAISKYVVDEITNTIQKLRRTNQILLEP